jgi:hypothetical protein
MTQRGNPDWKKGGPSPNPGGRPKVDPADREALMKLNPRAIARLAEMLESEDESVVMKAIERVLERNMGKPAQRLEHAGAEGEDGGQAAITVRFVKAEGG